MAIPVVEEARKGGSKPMRGISLFIAVLTLAFHSTVSAQGPKATGARDSTPVWDDAALATWHVPLAVPGVEPIPLAADQFYRLPELKIYRSYPVYAPGKEPVGYLKKLGEAEPEIVFTASNLNRGGTDTRWRTGF
jgi:hypothetical protein